MMTMSAFRLIDMTDKDVKPTSADVRVVNEEPMPMTIVADRRNEDTVAQTDARVVAATRRSDANVSRVDNQQKISSIWESTQRIIALSVVETTLIAVSVIVAAPGVATIFGVPLPETATTAASTGVVFLASIANLVIGFYFGRTNHQRVGGQTTDAEQDIGR